MSLVKLSPSQLNGTVTAPPSKSDVHRAIICAALSGGVCRIAPVAMSNDIRATIGCVEALGAAATVEGNSLIIDGTKIFSKNTATLNCIESGSTMRFFIPIAAAGGIEAEFIGSGSLLSRPVGLFADILPAAGVSVESGGTLPLKLSGKLRSGTFKVPGNISSQYITGLLLALPLVDGDSEIVLTTPLQSAGYIDMTIACIKKFGVDIQRTDKGWYVKGGQRYIPRDYTTEGDWSQAAFFMASGALSGDVAVKGVYMDSTQGDRQIADLLRRFGADVESGDNYVRVRKSRLKGIDIDARQIPDLVPVLSVLACFADGDTVISGAERLRIKESDRLSTTAALINSLGGSVEEKSDGLIVHGTGLCGGTADGANDHRIVMSAAVAALCAEGDVAVTDMESINKSYPNFFEDYIDLGGVAECLSSEKI